MQNVGEILSPFVSPASATAAVTTTLTLLVNSGYKSTMRLNMTIMSALDYGDYNCVSKNELGTTRGVFHVQGS